ncbi:EAL domain-containing protein [Rhodoferax sp. GW822-FHT02A01]|uniref:sensor domain-containing protein n=1 Tax=Rhodoferax sp. GW822-FHT02A01 TaxID=3141537 RepID=UPI00315D69A8
MFKTDIGDCVLEQRITTVEPLAPSAIPDFIRALGYALDLGTESVFICDDEIRFVYVNDAVIRQLGYRRDELLRMGPPDIDLNITREKCLDIFQNPQGFPFTFETVHRTQTGKVIPVDIHGINLDIDGRRYAVAIARDISARKKMNEELQRNEKYQRTLLNNFPFSVWLQDPDGRLLIGNDAFARDAGKASIDDLVGLTIFPSEQSLRSTADDITVMSTGNALHIEEKRRGPDGNFYWAETWTAPLLVEGQMQGTVGYSRDISSRKQTENSLAKTLAFVQGVIDAFPDILFEGSHDGRYLNVWTRNPELLAASRENMLGRSLDEVLSPKSAAIAWAAFREANLTGTSHGKIISIDTPVGLRSFEISVSRMQLSDDPNPHFITVSRDVTERIRLQAELENREHEFRTLVEHSPDAIARFDLEQQCQYANPVLAQSLGYASLPLRGFTPCALFGTDTGAMLTERLQKVQDSHQRAEFDMYWKNTQGRQSSILVSLTPEFDNTRALASVLMVGRDITELRTYQDTIHQMAFYDTLTGLPNRALFHEHLTQLLADAAYHGQLAGIMVVDVDRFKDVNDTLGHGTGDQLLKEVATRLRNCVRTYDTVARLGGDEFGVLLPKIKKAENLGHVASKILSALNPAFDLAGGEIFVTCSVGIAVYPQDSEHEQELLKYAGSAMYFAKRSGRNGFRFYAKELTASAQARLSLESDLRRATKRQELMLHYQPKVSLSTGAVVGCEALLRWNHPERGMVSPVQFISVAEDIGVICEMGRWVLQEACKTAIAWNRNTGAGMHGYKVAVNLSPRQFFESNWLEQLIDIVRDTGCAPHWLEFEITESLLLDEDDRVLPALMALRDLGATIAIDDFGTGYSALGYLTRFPIDTLKIDRSFVQTVTTDRYRSELVKAILSIARCLNLVVVAEGVENPEQAEFLNSEGCQLAQGFLYGRPVPKDQLLVLPELISQRVKLDQA